ncbi:MAG: DUF2334 domain-containing protein, partial [Verrucomicrobiales bacterium]|nr:DUF2334 domain-containing protein [Verrucomicrobiales bacterium]
MHYVVLRDDDTNALTPIECLERLYRPFLDRGLAVNLATIPNVGTDVRYGEGILEGFLIARNGAARPFVPIGDNEKLVAYLRTNPTYHVVQHGCNHDFPKGRCEFDQSDRDDIVRRIERGCALLREAGLGTPETFVAPYDRFTPLS